jgi:hypothetical protein
VYRRKEPHAFQYLSERATFWIAVISVFAFVTGNMIGQHGWSVFWKSVMGEGSENTIVFTGMVPPVAKVPDYEKWGRLGGDPRVHTFREVPTDLLVPLPTYIRHGETSDADPSLRRVFFVEHLGTYENGRGKGSHVGVDISLPEGTPVQSVANGVVVRSSYDAGGFGNFVVVKHPNVPNIDEQGKKSAVYSVYAHLSSALVTEGTVVQKGEQIGLSGHTGNATAPHLHFQMDRDTAPFHPYWPFTSSEQRSAGLSFVQAIDKGLDRENGVNFTVDSMLTVQAYESYTAPVVAQATSSSSSRLSTIEQRKQARLAKLSVVSTLIAFNDQPVPQASSSSSVVSSSSSVSVSSVATVPAVPAVPRTGAVAKVEINHDGSFSLNRGWEKVKLVLLDEQGNLVTVPASNEKIYLTTAFGRAEFKPAVVSTADFKNGVLTVEMLPQGKQTVVVLVEPTGSMSKPMKYSN